MGLLDGDIAALFGSVMGSFYLDATLHRWSSVADGQGGGTSTYADPEAVKAQVDQTSQAQQRGDGYTDTDQRILVLASGVAPISTDDQITVGGIRWAIASISTDPAASYYDLRGRRA